MNGRRLLVGKGDPGVDDGPGEAQAGLDTRPVSPLLLRTVVDKMTGMPTSQAAEAVAAAG